MPQTFKTCYLCAGTDLFQRPGKVRDSRRLKVLQCRSCGLVFLSSFDHIDAGFYAGSGMHGGGRSVRAWAADSAEDDGRRFERWKAAIKGRRVLDYGCGNAGFLLRARSVASRCAGIEPERRLTRYFRSRRLRVRPSLAELPGVFDVITLFHVLEHLPDPRSVLRDLAGRLAPRGRLIVEVPSADDALLTLYRCVPFSEFTYWSCHLFMFNSSTLRMLASQAGLKVPAVGHIQRYPLSNHLHWLAEGKPGGHQLWSSLNAPDLAAAYEKRLAALRATDTVVAELSL